MGLWVSPAGSVGANPCATGAPRPQTPPPFEKGGRKLNVCIFYSFVMLPVYSRFNRFFSIWRFRI